MTADEILQLLDEELVLDPQHDPPYLYQLWTHCYPADARLTVFRSDKRWVIFFEFVSYWCQWQGVQNDIWCYDSALKQGVKYEDHPLELLDEETGEPLDGTSSMNERQFSLLWNEERWDLTPTEADYAKIGIDFDPEREDPDARKIAQILRYVCHNFDHSFFVPEQELRDILTENGDAGLSSQDTSMALFLQTRHWDHPDIGLHEHPSQTASFPILARAIVSGDLVEWNAQNPSKFNTDWRIYDEAEKVEHQQNKALQEQQERVWASLPPEVQEEFRRQGLFGVGCIQILEAPEDAGEDQ